MADYDSSASPLTAGPRDDPRSGVVTTCARLLGARRAGGAFVRCREPGAGVPRAASSGPGFADVSRVEHRPHADLSTRAAADHVAAGWVGSSGADSTDRVHDNGGGAGV